MSILYLENLTKNFAGVRALNKVDMNVRKGTVHSLLGPNGSGKTTCFNVVTGILSATSGKISFNGNDITKLDAHLRTKVGISRTFQIPRVIPDMTCLENVMVGRHCQTGIDILGTFFRLPFTASRQEKEIEEKALELLEFVGLREFSERVAGDLAWVDEQLLQLARAIACEPKLLLLDEPTAGMGGAETEKIKKVIKQIQNTGTTIILVAHDIKLVMEVSDQVTVLNFGTKIAEGTVEQIQRDPKVVEAYLGEQ